MLTELCGELKNYFLKNREDDVHTGTFTIQDGAIEDLPFLKEGQYFRVVGSTFNDGVWKYRGTWIPGDPPAVMKDEVFDGAIWAMSVPRDVIAISLEIDAYNQKAAEMAEKEGGFASESFGGYSYSLFSAPPVGMQAAYDKITRSLRRYRRLSVL